MNCGPRTSDWGLSWQESGDWHDINPLKCVPRCTHVYRDLLSPNPVLPPPSASHDVIMTLFRSELGAARASEEQVRSSFLLYLLDFMQ